MATGDLVLGPPPVISSAAGPTIIYAGPQPPSPDLEMMSPASEVTPVDVGEETWDQISEDSGIAMGAWDNSYTF